MNEHTPYTHVTAAIDEGITRLNVSFRTPYLRVMVLNVGDRRPVLGLYGSEGEVSISTTGGGPVTERDVTLARELADATARYLADCERLHADQTPTQTTRPGEASA
ncbi:hypothetical protein GCM10010517_36180 [Streptosporangium fragile]|uniref:Uncharacterized protein n=1 Tax=Streptosporangium fragile TaxID=46186 RepID=A0ABN3VYV0_9ACTN